MSSIVVAGNTSGSVTLSAPAVAGTATITLPTVTGNMLSSTGVTASVLGTVTNKVAINIGGTVYYLLASTSAV